MPDIVSEIINLIASLLRFIGMGILGLAIGWLFESSYRCIIDEYEVTPREIAIFIPCAIRKPYSTSPSHQLIRMIISQVLSPSRYHIVVFGTCGIVPCELEEMYPYAHYRYMLGKCTVQMIKGDFLRIETERVAGYLEKTRDVYRFRIGYCLDLFREALIWGQNRRGFRSISFFQAVTGSIKTSRRRTVPSRKGVSPWMKTLESSAKG